MMHLSRIVAVCLAVATPAISQIATLTPSTPGHWLDRELHQPGSHEHSEYTKAVAGRLTGHFHQDVVVLDGGEVLLVSAPGFHDTVVALQDLDVGTPIDIAILRNSSPSDQALDRLVVLGDQGVCVRSFDGSSDKLIGMPNECIPELIATHPSDDDQVFLVADGACVFTASVGGPPTFTLTAVLKADALCAECIDWDGNGTIDLAVATSTGVDLVGVTANSFLPFNQNVGDPADLCLVDTNGTETLAWLRTANGQLPHLQLHPAGNTTGQTVLLDDHDYVRITSGDWNLDNHDDVALSSTSNDDVTVIMNLGGLFQAIPGFAFRTEVIGDGQARQPNACNAVFTDLDGDMDADLFVPVQRTTSDADPQFSFIRPTAILNDTLVTLSEPGNGTELWTPGANTQNILNIQVDVLPVAANHLEVMIWESTTPGNVATTPAAMKPQPTYRRVLQRNLHLGHSELLAIDVSASQYSDGTAIDNMLGGPAGGYLTGERGFCMITVRPVIVNPMDEITEAGAPYMAALHLYDDALISIAPNGWTPGTGVRVGGIVRHRPLPKVQPGGVIPVPKR